MKPSSWERGRPASGVEAHDLASRIEELAHVGRAGGVTGERVEAEPLEQQTQRALVLVQRRGLVAPLGLGRAVTELGDRRVRLVEINRLLAAPDDDERQREQRAAEETIFEKSETMRQLVSERHGAPPQGCKGNGPPRSTHVDPLAARQAWRTWSAVAPWLCVTAFRRLCSEQRCVCELLRTSNSRSAVARAHYLSMGA